MDPSILPSAHHDLEPLEIEFLIMSYSLVCSLARLHRRSFASHCSLRSRSPLRSRRLSLIRSRVNETVQREFTSCLKFKGFWITVLPPLPVLLNREGLPFNFLSTSVSIFPSAKLSSSEFGSVICYLLSSSHTGFWSSHATDVERSAHWNSSLFACTNTGFTLRSRFPRYLRFDSRMRMRIWGLQQMQTSY